MVIRKSRAWTPEAAAGVIATIAEKARARRFRQRGLTELNSRDRNVRRNDLAPRLELRFTPIEDLKPASRQVRRRDAVQGERIRSSIERFGICRPILVDVNLTIIEGHGIWEETKALGVAEVPCVVVDHLDAAEQRLLRIALNRIGERGAWDTEALRGEFADLIELGEEVVLSGFELAEVDALLLDDDGQGREDDVQIEELGHAVSRLGDVWVLGEHRLAQGDARDPNVYARLIGEGEQARVALTDEPFNVPNLGHVTANARHGEFAMAHGEMSREEFFAFNQDWMRPAIRHLLDGGLLATFIDWRSVEIVLACGRELGLDLLNLVVWTKSNAGQGSLWRSQHELLPVFKKGDAPAVNNVELGRLGRWRSNIWTYPGASSLNSDSREGLEHHPTVKPCALLEDALLDVTFRGDVVLEPFAGSGSTLVASEKTGRVCRAIEIDGAFCDLTIRRWQAMSGKKACLVETSETFAEVEARRVDEAPAFDREGVDYGCE
jgi:DNA modification methylase